MTHDDIIRMAREAGFTVCRDEWVLGEMLERFAKLVRDDYSNKHANLWLDRCHKFMLEEREACAKVAEDFLTSGRSPLGRSVADAIRARGEHD